MRLGLGKYLFKPDRYQQDREIHDEVRPEIAVDDIEITQQQYHAEQNQQHPPSKACWTHAEIPPLCSVW